MISRERHWKPITQKRDIFVVTHTTYTTYTQLPLNWYTTKRSPGGERLVSDPRRFQRMVNGGERRHNPKNEDFESENDEF